MATYQMKHYHAIQKIIEGHPMSSDPQRELKFTNINLFAALLKECACLW